MRKKIRWLIGRVSGILERVMAIIVLVAIAVAIISLFQPFLDFWNHRLLDGAFLDFIERVFNIVIGIEFFKLLCRPGADTILEVLMFCVTRHMIVHDTTAVENLLTIIGVAGILIVKKYLNSKTKKSEA